MAKRFIDTELFNDKWFMLLKKDSKLFWIYLITSCNHAGIIEFNEPLIKFKTGLNSLDTVIKDLDNRLIPLDNDYYFVPKFLEYQYNNFPNSNVRSQQSAINILRKFKLWDEENQTVIKGLVNSYVYEHDNVSGHVKKKTPKQFYDEQLELSENDSQYKLFISWLFGDNFYKRPLNHVLKMREQVNWDQFPNLVKINKDTGIKIKPLLEELEKWIMSNPKGEKTTMVGMLRTFANNKIKK